jgi:imidazoleglycerol-phosphate dehydratase
MIEKRRVTKETQIYIALNLEGSGESSIDSGIGFFDHMLESFARHALVDLEVSCKGDLEIDGHHSVEDIGIVLGQLIGEAVYPVANIERFGNATVVMDEASVCCDLDLCRRAYLHFDLPVEGMLGEFDAELTEEFFKAVVFNAPFTMHMVCQRGRNRHHMIEAAFKAFAVALRRAVTRNERMGIPSTKGII